MENYDERRRQWDEERQQARSEDRGRDRDAWWRGERSHDDDRPRRAERGWLDYDRDYGRSDESRGRREDPLYGQGGREERSRFSPDWSREGAEPRYSDDPYYSRNRERGGSEEYSRRGRSESWQDSDSRRWQQRARSAVPPEQREMAERATPGDYYDPDWPYHRGRQGGDVRDVQRSREDDQGSHYRGWYSRSATPFSYSGGTGYLYSESMTLHGPYTGRGPKGYKRSDQQIIEDACQRLERDGEIDASDIEVTAEDGVIRLRGMVRDRQTKRRAEECVESIYGARDVMNELRVQREQSQTSQSGFGSQGSQGTQASQAGRGSTSSPSQPSTSTRTGSGTSASDQTPKH
jgi:BON domain